MSVYLFNTRTSRSTNTYRPDIQENGLDAHKQTAFSLECDKFSLYPAFGKGGLIQRVLGVEASRIFYTDLRPTLQQQ